MNCLPAPDDRLAELVSVLSGADADRARIAVGTALGRNGAWGDALLNVADALVTLRHDNGAAT